MSNTGPTRPIVGVELSWGGPVILHVGFAVVGETPWFFGTNIQVSNFDDLQLRQQLTMECSEALGILKTERKAAH